MRPLAIFLFVAFASAKATVYFIRHGEKPNDGDGLSTAGEKRAQCLRTVFGASSGYNIGHIMAQTPQSGMMYLEVKDVQCNDTNLCLNRWVSTAPL